MNLRSRCKETLMIVYDNEVFRRGSGLAILFLPSFSHTFMHLRGPRKQLRDSHKKKTNHCSSSLPFSTFLRNATFIPRGSRFVFSKLWLTRYVELRANILRDVLKGEREKTLHYNYSIKKFKSLNITRCATIQTALKVEGTRTRYANAVKTSRATARYLMHKHATETCYSIFRNEVAVTGHCLTFSELFCELITCGF